MKRNPRKVKWTKAYRRLHGKDMTQDSTFEFERKRNRPERYDRNLAENTLKAIKKIDKVRVEREARHHAKRMKGKRAKEQKEAAKELEQSIHMVKAPAALQQEPFSYFTKDQSQGFPAAIGGKSHGGVILLLWQAAVLKFCVCCFQLFIYPIQI
ncbi:ribosomal protein L24e family protein [Actinidia rufa]|uniref:Ribosomal protein L24e family protein n=1 Tax=Actinidia rufa TaxID=165716 RepID=A0A7J0H999_9ERIC|nr:ribosomal protein L24e family protein [Actinidia rufa]